MCVSVCMSMCVGSGGGLCVCTLCECVRVCVCWE